MDISYRIQKSHPNSLYMTPYARVYHGASQVARISSEYRTNMEISYHAYFFFKNMKQTARNKMSFFYSMLLGRLVISLLSRNCKWLIFTIKAEYNFARNLKDVKQGIFDSFEIKKNLIK
jgi:ribosome biogenesis protein Nip4